MDYDIRQQAAEYYDRFSDPGWDDVSFYQSRLPPHGGRVLELGCGTGRVLLPMVERAAYIHGLDLSPAMLAICKRKLADAKIGRDRAQAEQADITSFDLTDRMPQFDLITAPFRVMQNLETDEQVDGMMRCIKRHMAPGGQAILNTFKPRGGAEALQANWASRDGSQPYFEELEGEQIVKLFDDCTRFQSDPTIVFPRLTYRRYDKAGIEVDEAHMEIAMRVWQPDELVELVKRHGFQISERLGGYEGEAWGEGSELIVVLTL